MQKLFEALNTEGHLDGLEIDKDEILEDLGFRRVTKSGLIEYPDFSAIDLGGSYDLALQSIGYISYISEVLAVTAKRYKDSEVSLDDVFNKTLGRNANNLKVTEAKIAAKSSDEYVELSRRISSLEAWKDYLKRLIEDVEKIHYMAKSKVLELQNTRGKVI